jgi:hypothetical protein
VQGTLQQRLGLHGHDVAVRPTHRPDSGVDAGPACDKVVTISCGESTSDHETKLFAGRSVRWPLLLEAIRGWRLRGMDGAMTGWFEVRVDRSNPCVHYRLFCHVYFGAAQ